jgi:hypothetical protein
MLPLILQIRIIMQSTNLPDGVFWIDGGQAEPKMINIDVASYDGFRFHCLSLMSVDVVTY